MNLLLCYIISDESNVNTEKITYMRFNLYGNIIKLMERNTFVNKLYSHNLIYIHVFKQCNILLLFKNSIMNLYVDITT